MKLFLIARTMVALGLAILLIWRGPLEKSLYRAGFFIGLAGFASVLSWSGGTWDLRMSNTPYVSTFLIPIFFVAITPYLLLLEAGVAGYRGFSSGWLHYFSLIILCLGGATLLLSLVLPLMRLLLR